MATSAVSIFFDLDGVLAHFVRGALKKHGREDVPVVSVPWGIEAHLGIAPEVFWSALDREFVETLEPYADGLELFKAAETVVGSDNIGILSSPWDTPGCFEGKRAWVAKHLPGYEKRFFTGAAKEMFAGPGKMLVDDRNENVDRFRSKHGCAVLVPRPWNRRHFVCDGEGHFQVSKVVTELATEALSADRLVRDVLQFIASGRSE